MKLDEVIKASEAKSEEPTTVQKVDEEVEKLAEYLEAFSEEDTLLDDLARAAVIADMLEKKYGN